MPDITATSHETLQGHDAFPMIVWLGDEKEINLTKYFDGFLNGVGWYWIVMGLDPKGPFETSMEAFIAFHNYVSQK